MSDKAVSWKSMAREAIKRFGHRNWIVVADAAYPCHSSLGIDTFVTETGLLETLPWVLGEIKAAPHLRPLVHVDSEFDHLDEFPGTQLTQVRVGLNEILSRSDLDGAIVRRPHDEIIASLNRASEAFRVLVLKTSELVPYSTVFIELQCGYWSDSQEREFRTSISKA